jgi:hypothetical protein
MDLAWMKRDWTLAASGVAESFITFGLVFARSLFFDFPPLQCAIAAAIAMATRRRVLLACRTTSEGQVTERALNLTALNSLIASILVTILLASAHYDAGSSWRRWCCIRFTCSSARCCWAASSRLRAPARAPGRAHAELHFTLIVGWWWPRWACAQSLKLSVILALLAFGSSRATTRAARPAHVDLAPAAALLHRAVRDHGCQPAVTAFERRAGALRVHRRARGGQGRSACSRSPAGRLRMRQSWALGATLLPMSGLAMLLQHDVSQVYPQFARR